MLSGFSQQIFRTEIGSESVLYWRLKQRINWFIVKRFYWSCDGLMGEGHGNRYKYLIGMYHGRCRYYSEGDNI